MHVLWEVVMTHKRIPKDWVIKRSTPFFTKENVPSALLTHHNTAAGVFGQLCVMEGTVTYYGFADENATEPEIKVVINAGAFATSPPQLGNISLNSFLNVSIPSVCAEIAFPVLNASIFEIHFPLFPQYNLSASSTSNPWFTFFPTMLTSTGTPFFFEYVIAI